MSKRVAFKESLYPHFEDLCNVLDDIIPDGSDAVIFRRQNGRIGVVTNNQMAENGIYTTKLDWKAIKKIAYLKNPALPKIDFVFRLDNYFQMVRQAAFLNERANLPTYDDKFYFPDDGIDEDEYGLFHKADASNWSLDGSNEYFSSLKPPIQGLSQEELDHLCDGSLQSSSTTTGRFASFRKWFGRIRDRMRR